MDEFLKMDIFFVVATGAVILVTLLVVFILVLVARILRNVDRISETVSEEVTLLRTDVADLRGHVRNEGVKARHFLRFFQSAVKRFFGGGGIKK